MDLGELVVSIRMRTDALEKGFNETQRKLQQQQQETKKAAATMKELESSYTRIAVVATGVFIGIVAAVMSGVKAHNEYRNSMVGLQSIARGVGADMGKLQQSVEALTKDGLMPASDAATAFKNLLSRGFTDDQAVQMLNRLKDSAAFGRQASLSFGEAVRSATEGLKNENSILVDNAGVTKNVSVMWKEYAAQIGKSVNDLSIAEKRQAEFNGIMNETKNQIGDAARYAEEFSGQQAALGAQTVKLAQAFGGSQIPVLSTLLSIFQPILTVITELIKRNPELTATVTAMILAFFGLAAAAGAVAAAKLAWAAASGALIVALRALALNPIILGLTALIGVLTLVTSAKAKAKEETDKLKQAEEDYNRVIREGIQQNEIATYEKKIADLQKLKQEYDNVKAKLKEFDEMTEKLRSGEAPFTGQNRALEADALYKELARVQQGFKDLKTTAEKAGEQIDGYTKTVSKARTGTTEQVNEQAKQIAMNLREVMSVEALIAQYKRAEAGSSDWQQAQDDLAKQFPQFATATGINIKAIEGLIIVRRNEMEVQWQSMQLKAQEIITTKQLAAAEIEAQIAATDQVNLIERKGRELAKLNGEIAALNALATGRPTDVTGVAPVVTKAPSSSTYQNKALDDANRLLEHKKRLNQLTLQDELSTLEAIKAKHVRTAEERMTIEERIYDVKKAIRDKEKVLLDDQKQAEADAIDSRTQLYRSDAEDRLIREKLTAAEQFRIQKQMQTDIIDSNRSYLQSVLDSENYTASEKEKIQRQITEVIRQAINDRLQLERDYAEEQRSQQVDSINKLSSGVQGALREKYQAERNAQEGNLNAAIKANDEWAKLSIESTKSVYDARIKAAQNAADREIELLNQTLGAQIKAVQDELAALDQAEKQKTRAELDAEDLTNANRLRTLIEYERDEFAKAAMQSQLNDLLAGQSKRHDQEQLSDKKDALKTEEQTLKDKLREQTDAIKQQLADKKEMLAADRDAEIERLNQISEAQKASLSVALAATQEHYNKLLTAKNLQAEAEKLIVKNQQTDIIALLNDFGSSYEITGQTLGEKMYEGFREKVSQISSLIASINNQIDAARNAAVSVMNQASASNASASSGSGISVIGAIGKLVSDTVGKLIPNSITAPIMIDGKKVAEATVPILADASRQAGRSL